MSTFPTLGQMESLIPTVSYAFIYKGILQEHCRKLGLCDPIYLVSMDGEDDHNLSFTAEVSINKEVYKSVGKCYSKKEAEQCAAKAAISEIYNSPDKNMNLAQMVHETGLCKCMLQEYAHRARLSPPTYECTKNYHEEFMPSFTCTVKVGGIPYNGIPGRTKKAAQKNAAIVACATIMATISATVAAFEIVNGSR